MISWSKRDYVGTREDGTHMTYYEGTCLSTDVKPTDYDDLANGSCLKEIDTSTLYFWDEENGTWRGWGA